MKCQYCHETIVDDQAYAAMADFRKYEWDRMKQQHEDACSSNCNPVS